MTEADIAGLNNLSEVVINERSAYLDFQAAFLSGTQNSQINPSRA
jgi:hypothetical protein